MNYIPLITHDCWGMVYKLYIFSGDNYIDMKMYVL